MDIDDVVAAFRRERRELAWPGETLDARPRVTRRSNDVSAFVLDARNADEAIREEIAYFDGLGQGFEWKAFSFDEPADLVERLRSAGFEVGAREAVVVYDLAHGLGPFQAESSLTVRRVEDLERLDHFRQVAEAAFGRDYGFTTGQLAEALQAGAAGHDAYVAYFDGTPAAVGRLYTNPCSAFAGLYGGGTRPEFRGRGLYRAVVAARAQDAAASGARYLQVDALPTSLPILERMGFVRIADTWPCAWEPPR